MRIKSNFVASAEINGKQVSFFTPPHDEPDFLWVDMEELAKAFLPRSAARALLKSTQKFDGGRPIATAVNGSKIVTIISHPMAKGLCAMIDHNLGEAPLSEEEWGGGPRETKYVVAMADTQRLHAPLGFDTLFKAFHNQGGPQLRDFVGGVQ